MLDNQIKEQKIQMYKVLRVYSKKKKKDLVAENLTLEEAQKMVKTEPDSKRTMLCYYKQEG